MLSLSRRTRARGARTDGSPLSMLACAVLVLACACRAQADPDVSAVTFAAHVAPFFDTHCVRCHGPDEAKSDITLHTLRGDFADDDELERWELVLEMLEGGEMPPEDEPRPTAEERARVVKWIDSELRAAVAAGPTAAAAPTVRRLTNFEYHNTMRDLLGIELELTQRLPEDPSRPYRFHNTAHYLLMGLEQIDRYEECARRALRSAIVDPRPPEIHRVRESWGADSRRGMPDPTGMQPDEIGVFGNRNRTVVNGMQVRDWPETGAFRIRVKASAILPPGVESMPLRIMLGYDLVGVGVGHTNPAEPVGTLELSNSVDEPRVFELTGRIENFPAQPERRYRRGGKIDGRLVVIPPHLTVTPINVYDDGTLNDEPDPLAKPRAVVEWIEFEAPVAEEWPPAHHRRILFDSPLRESDPDAYVREVLRRFLPRAFRRPVGEDEVERFAKVHAIVESELGLETLEESMRETLAMALITPDFLYHTVATDAATRQYEVASRLSYFLWGSMPDDELFALAAGGRLDDPSVLEAQARRLLADERAADFVDDFATQWLALDRMRAVPIDLQRFPRFLYTIKRGELTGREVRNRPTIRDFMHAETVGFVHELIRRNASLLELVDSDFAMLNQPLAVHYGVEGVQGHRLRPVPVGPEHHLGGLLTQGSFLVGTATGAAPHTVYRAVWLREAILGDEVPAPPADVPALEDSVGEEAALAVTLKDALRLHRTKASCNECHARLDPWGIPFEEYDATGRYAPRVPPQDTRVEGFRAATHGDLDGYREYLAGLCTVDVEADAVVPNGPEVDGVAALKAYLLEARRDDIAENVARRLLTYALGRELTYRDRFVVEELCAESRRNGYRLQDLIVAVCKTSLFMGRTER